METTLRGNSSEGFIKAIILYHQVDGTQELPINVNR